MATRSSPVRPKIKFCGCYGRFVMVMRGPYLWMLLGIVSVGRILPGREIKRNYPLKYTTRNMPHKSYKVASLSHPKQQQFLILFQGAHFSTYFLTGELVAS